MNYIYIAHFSYGYVQMRFTSSIMLTYIYNYIYFILTHPPTFAVGGNRSARRKPTTFGRALAYSFQRALMENRTHDTEVKGARANHCATEAPESTARDSTNTFICQNIMSLKLACVYMGNTRFPWKKSLDKFYLLIHACI